MSGRLLCIYHKNCADGFTAAWIVRNAFPIGFADFYAGTHQDTPPDVTGRKVLFVDFSYKRPVMKELCEKAEDVTVLDHHQSAKDDLEGLHKECKNFNSHFDMDRSGAGLTWDTLRPNDVRPQLVNHVEDRDLFRFKIPHTREFQAAVFSYDYTFSNWDMLAQMDPKKLAEDGTVLERKHHKDIKELVAVLQRSMTIGGVEVPVANMPYTYTSDAGHLMAKDAPFAACYWLTPKGWVFSLRSTENGMDVSEIASQYGGGGHKHAAGFRIPTERLEEFL